MGNDNIKPPKQRDYLTMEFNRKMSKSNSKHHGHSHKRKHIKKLDDFLLKCEDFEITLKTFQVKTNNPKLINSVHQRLLSIQKVLVDKMSILEKANENNSNKTKQKVSSNLGSHNKSLSSSTSSVYSKKSSKGLSNLSLFKEFFKQVNCPFCDEHQPDKYYLIKHLDEDCLPFKMKSFKKETDLPYSVFQILPKNWFKCNICPNVIARDIQGYLNHINCSSHENSRSKSSSKSYTDSLFCSVCKLLVPNNFTELNMHLNHEQHKKRRQIFANERIFQEKNICCIYYKNGEYYCFLCSRKFIKRNNLIEFMSHLSGDGHKQNLEKHSIKATKAYCEFCEKELNTFEIWNHFQSLEHECKVLEQKFTQYYLLCVYCSSHFSDLTELSNHMNGGCKEMGILRKDGVNTGPEASVKSAEMEKGVSGDPDIKEGYCLFMDVSDDLDVSDLKNYLEKFGRIISIYNTTGNKFMIVFAEKDTMNKILNYKESLIINGKILTVSESLFEKVENQSNQSESESDEENDTSDDDSLSDDGEINNLFQEVGSHLLKKIENIDSADDDEILMITEMTLKGTMTFSGFRGCQLLLPNETRLNLHCLFKSEIFKSVEEELQMPLVLDSKKRIYNKSKVALELIEKSPFWEQAECIPTSISYVKCIHKRTRKSCIITFSLSDKELTKALSECLKENDFIRPFLLTLKWWLSSQETFLSDFEYPLIAVILFFLTSKSLVRPFSVSHQPIHSKILDALSDGPNLKATKPVKNIAEGDVGKLFQMFLEFISIFEFDKYAICFPLHVPVPITVLRKMLNVKDNILESIWIMDVFCTWNYTSHVQKTELRSFQNLINKTLQEI